MEGPEWVAPGTVVDASAEQALKLHSGELSSSGALGELACRAIHFIPTFFLAIHQFFGLREK